MSDQRRVCDLSAGELLEAALHAAGGFGLRVRMVVELYAEPAGDGWLIRQARARPASVEHAATVGRRQLLAPRIEAPRDDLAA